MAPIYIALIHHPVVNKHGEIVTTSLTNFDVHDLGRTSRTFGVQKVFLVTPVEAQLEMARFIKKYWREGIGTSANPDRSEAFSILAEAKNLEETCLTIEKLHAKKPSLVATSAKKTGNTISFNSLRKQIESDSNPYLLLFGTGFGLAPEIFEKVDYTLDPILGAGDYNHLPVRGAVAIILDRLLGSRE